MNFNEIKHNFNEMFYNSNLTNQNLTLSDQEQRINFFSDIFIGNINPINNIHFIYDLAYNNSLNSFKFISFDNNFYLKQLDPYFNFSNTFVENSLTIYNYSIPTTKLYYPEPFLAAPSFMHTDMWYVHILVYQYWLWFLFGALITVFFCLFLITLRWCNIRIRPKRETRGVSRAKCGDLITACVPVSWATSIIVTETTDAMDYFDGSGTTEFVVGIRAYQWGWEYYYPKDIDLNFNINVNYNLFIGNSLKYTINTGTNLNLNNFWKYYQQKNFDSIITPSHLLFLPTDLNHTINLFNLNDIGSNTQNEPVAFKNIKTSSKFFSNNLFTIPTFKNHKFLKLETTFSSENFFLNSYLFGLKRQHNFLSQGSLINSSKSNLDLLSLNQLFLYNFSSDLNFKNNFFFGNNYQYFFNKNTNEKNLNEGLNIFFNFSNKIKYTINFNFLFNHVLNFINYDSDKPKSNLILLKYKNLLLQNFLSNNLTLISSINNDSDLINNYTLPLNNKLKNKTYSYQINETFSPNRAFLPGEQFLNNFTDSKPQSFNFNLSLYNNNLVYDIDNNYLNFQFSENMYQLKNLKQSFSFNNIRKIKNHPATFSLYRQPILSSNILLNWENYDKPLDDNNVSLIFQNDLKDTRVPLTLFSNYWETFFTQTSENLRIFDLNQVLLSEENFYLPLFLEYYDYDFRNLQALQLFEDLYWDSTYSPYIYDDYLNLKDFFLKDNYFLKLDGDFGDDVIKYNTSLTPFKKHFYLKNQSNPLSFYLDEDVINSQFTNSLDLSNISFINFINNFEDSYESLKLLENLYFINNKFFWVDNRLLLPLPSHTYIANNYRSDFDEYFWYVDFNFKNDFQLFQKFNNFLLNPNIFENFIPNFNDETIKASNSLSIRPYTRSAMTNYNAMQKVFRSRFEEGRSFSKLNEIANSEDKQPMLNSNKINFERSIGKEKNNFYKQVFYKQIFKSNLNYFYLNNSTLNYFFFDFPFLVSGKSDPARYLWFDWYAKWGELAVQPSSSAKYAIHGMPYFNKIFEYTNNNNDQLNETENYLNRIIRARKNFLTSWSYSPFLSLRNNNWLAVNFLTEINNINITNKLTLTKTLLKFIASDWRKNFIETLPFNFNFSSSFSNINSYGKTSLQPLNSTQGYFYTLNYLTDILTKREFLYRELLVKLNKTLFIPTFFCATPSNILFKEIKNTLLLNNPLNLSYKEKSLFTHFFKLNNNDIMLKKNQYRPLKKGISNMIKLHATGAIALPVELRLQILASSKDVIHSWAIPSAGVKIDCVPGYSSHRIIIFLATGIFWGQCMEICGRYHHWMPIVIYFMKRDLFFLWCTHFIFWHDTTQNWLINDKFNLNTSKPISYDPKNWLNELYKW